MPVRILFVFYFVLLIAGLFLYSFKNGETALAISTVAEWKTGDFSIEIKDWDNPLGVEGLDNSGLNQDTCSYKVEGLNPATGAWEITRAATQRICAIQIPITVGIKTGEGYKGTTGILAQTADCKYSGENSCRITAWAQDYAGNNSFGTEYMLTRIYSIDFRPPTSIIDVPGVAAGKRASDNTYWFNSQKSPYSISITDTDVGSGIDPNGCWYRIVDTKEISRDTATVLRTCSTPILLKVGPNSNSTNNCVTQDSENNNKPACFVYIHSVDKAGNGFDRIEKLHIDYTAPTAQ